MAYSKRIDRISAHEKVCAERMKTLIKTIDEMKMELKDLRNDMNNLRTDMNKGKGAIMLLVILGGIVGTVLSIIKFWK